MKRRTKCPSSPTARSQPIAASARRFADEGATVRLTGATASAGPVDYAVAQTDDLHRRVEVIFNIEAPNPTAARSSNVVDVRREGRKNTSSYTFAKAAGVGLTRSAEVQYAAH